MIDELELRTALLEIADRDEPSSAPSTGLVRRGRRARIGRTARTAGAFGAAGVVLAGLALLPRPTTSAPEPVPLALAAQTTAQTTFHLTIDTTAETSPQELRALPWEGKYDPIHDRGYVKTPVIGRNGLSDELRQIGPYCYYGNSTGQWYRTSRSNGCLLASGSPETATLGNSGSPGELLAELKHAGNVSYAGRTGSGSHATDTYRFSYPFSMNTFTWTKSGTVDIDVASRRIVKVSYRMAPNPGDGLRPVPIKVVIQLDDFGTPVDVTAPTKLDH